MTYIVLLVISNYLLNIYSLHCPVKKKIVENVFMFEYAESQHPYFYVMYILEDSKGKTGNKQSNK